VVFPGIGHTVMAQAPAQLVTQIERHLGSAALGPLRAPVLATASHNSQLMR